MSRSVGALLIAVAIAATPALAYAQHGMGGGGHASGGGGGGGHFSGGGGGGHAFGGGSHFSGFGGHSFSSAGHSFAAPHYGFSGHTYGARYGAPAGGRGFTYAGAHYAGTAGGTHYVARSGYVSRPGTIAPAHPGVGSPSVNYYHGGGHAWVGGYWHGAYWPHCWYYPGWAWYLPVLPIGYVTYWWGGVPYYYWNSLYYTWNPSDNGYVVTDPPPAAQEQGSADPNGAYEQAPQSSYPDPSASGSGDVFVYPRNGQTPQQTDNDRYECHGWAVSQSGFDPTRPEQNGNPGDYRRAMVACLDARGYSAR
ncbi:MAG: hypothetical protein JO184_20325 [Gammaproteobacteria bacterium]|nr:hypothetical protein [Gammaproteobacteria bacterium]